MRRSKTDKKKMVTNVEYVRQLGRGLPLKEDLDELAHIARHGMSSDSVADRLDVYMLGVLEKHHGFGEEPDPDGDPGYEYDEYEDLREETDNEGEADV